MPFRAPCFALLLASFLSQNALAAIYTVGPAAAGACTHEFLVLAVEAARVNPGPDEIRASIAGGHAANVNLAIDNQELTLRGGFSDCAATIPTGRTLLGGSGSLAAPVLNIRSTSDNVVDMTIEGFDLIDGDNTNSGLGGGLRIGAAGTVRIRQCRIANNSARFGGGIAIEGNTIDSTRVFIGENVQIEDNLATGFGAGGGLYVTRASVTLGGVDTVVRRNRAADGGGIALIGNLADLSAQIDIQSGGQGDYGVVSHNSASFIGGGLYVWAGAMARLYTTDAARPMRLDHNTTLGDGGAIYADGTGARVAIWEGQVEHNESGQAGGAFKLHPAAALSLRSASAPDAPAGTVACTAANPCNRVIGNRTVTAHTANGAVLSVLVTNAPPATALFESTVFSAQSGATLFSDLCDDGGCTTSATVRLRNSLIASNPGTSNVIESESATLFECDLCTITATGAGLDASTPLISSNGAVTLTRSIVHEPGRDVIGGRIPSSLRSAHLLVHDAIDFETNATVRVDDPHFVDASSGDYRLAADSPAVDVAPVASDVGFDWTTPSLDLDRRPRVFDWPALSNLAGPVDLGAYERRDPNPIFADGFE